MRSESIPSDGEVRLETELSRVRREHLPVVEGIPRGEGAVKHGLDKELGIEVRWGGVKRSASNRLFEPKVSSASWNHALTDEERKTDRIHLVLGADCVGDQEPDQLHSTEACIAHAVENVSGRVRGKWDEARGRRLGSVRTPGEELDLGTTIAVRRADGARKLDAIKRIIGIQSRFNKMQGSLTSRRMRRCA